MQEYANDTTLLLFVLLLGLVAGTINERRHYRSITRRERALAHIPTLMERKARLPEREVQAVAFVCGSMVVSVDYFKRFLAWMRTIFGGRIRSYEPLIDRARREALLRMKELAPDADLYVGVRVETACVSDSSGRRRIGSAEAIAYGTAVKFRG